MKYRKDGTPQVQIGGSKPPYTLYVRAANTDKKSLRAVIEEQQRVARRHMSLAVQAWKKADDLEQELDAVIAASDQTNDEMHAFVVQQEPGFVNLLRRFVWRETAKENRLVGSNTNQAA